MDKEKCEEGNRQCNIENVQKRGHIPSHTNEFVYVQQHTTPHITQHIIKIRMEIFILGKIDIIVLYVTMDPSPVAT